MYQNFIFFIDLDWEKYVADGPTYLKEMQKLVSLSYSHKCKVFYSKRQLEEFTANCTAWDEDFVISIGNKLDVILENAIPVTNNVNGYIFQVNFQNDGSHLILANFRLRNILPNKEKTTIISRSEASARQSYLYVESNVEFKRTEVIYVGETADVIHSLAHEGPPRNFHYSNKHGENSRGQQSGAAPLKCSREEAQLYFNLAVADFSKRDKFYYYDTVHEQYVAFYYEGDNPENQWHGFHLNDTELRHIPTFVRRFFGK